MGVLNLVYISSCWYIENWQKYENKLLLFNYREI